MNKTINYRETTTLRKVFALAALGFLLVCAIGYLVSYVVDRTGIIREALDRSGRLNMDIYRSLNGNEEVMRRLAQLSIFGIILIIASSILNMVWSFRWFKASKGFIITAWTLYEIAQGLGFGILFITWNASDLLAVFGIAGGMFGVMALIGYLAKDLSGWGRWLFWGSVVASIASIIMVILYFTGIYNDTLSMFIWGFTGVLTLAWTAFDVWWVKKQTQMNLNQTDPEMEFRVVSFFGFRLLSDLIALVWIVLRFYSRLRK